MRHALRNAADYKMADFYRVHKTNDAPVGWQLQVNTTAEVNYLSYSSGDSVALLA